MSVKEQEARISALPAPDLDDEDNPEWTVEDFSRAVGPAELSDVELAAFPLTAARLGRPPLERPKVAVKVRLDQDLLVALRAEGPGWQTRVNATLREALEKRRA